MRIGPRAVCWLPAMLLLVAAARSWGVSLDLLDRPSVSGDWGGWRDRLDQRGITLGVAYIGDVVANVSGGVRRDATYVANLDVTLTARTEEMLGIDLGTVFFYGLLTHGGQPSEFVGDAQGVDNIAAPDTSQLYEAWWQHTVFDDRVSVLLGLYDVSSEFDVTETAALFLNSAFGTGPEFGQSGENGPSIFPFTALGGRIRTAPLDGVVWQFAALDGVPDDPDDPTRWQARLSHSDGALLLSELAYIWPSEDSGATLLDADARLRVRRRRVGRGWGDASYTFKAAVGVWGYTSKLPRVDDPQTPPATTHSHPGGYLLLDYSPTESALSAFMRAGLADGDVQQVDTQIGGGIGYTGLLPTRDDDRLGLGVTAAYNSHAFKQSAQLSGDHFADAEVTIELTYRAVVTPWLSMQPDLQYVIHPSGAPASRNAVIVALRTEVSF